MLYEVITDLDQERRCGLERFDRAPEPGLLLGVAARVTRREAMQRAVVHQVLHDREVEIRNNFV